MCLVSCYNFLTLWFYGPLFVSSIVCLDIWVPCFGMGDPLARFILSGLFFLTSFLLLVVLVSPPGVTYLWINVVFYYYWEIYYACIQTVLLLCEVE